MRGKRSKQYRKLIQQYQIHFGFREPYQVIVDAEFVKDTTKCKMDLLAALERTLHGTVKPLITQCSIRHLYAGNNDRDVQAAIEVAKNVCERRRCGHHPDTHPEPLSTLECLASVVDAKKDGTNKHRYCVASQEMDVRRAMRGVKGVPLIYVNRSVMILEPMPDATRRVCEGEEKGKLKDGFVRNLRAKTAGEKRKREEEDEVGESGGEEDGKDGQTQEGEKKKKKKNYGKKEPNPLSKPKPKAKPHHKMTDEEKLEDELRVIMNKKMESGKAEEKVTKTEGDGTAETKPKRKRRRRHKATAEGAEGGNGGDGGNEASAPVDGDASEAVQTEAAPAEAVEA